MLTTAIRALSDRILFGSHSLSVPLQCAVQRLLSGPREATFEFNKGPAAGCLFSCLTSHRYFFAREDYERDLLIPIQGMIRADSVVYDIGAHFGFWAIALSRLCPSGKVFAFEPLPENLARLRQNVAINSIKNIEIVPFALSDHVGTSHLSGNGSMSAIGDGAPNVETTTLDEFCKTHHAPDLMLIDVEGHAGEVLRGGSAILMRRFIPMVCEVHSKSEETAILGLANRKVIANRRSLHFPYRATVS